MDPLSLAPLAPLLPYLACTEQAPDCLPWLRPQRLTLTQVAVVTPLLCYRPGGQQSLAPFSPGPGALEVHSGDFPLTGVGMCNQMGIGRQVQ